MNVKWTPALLDQVRAHAAQGHTRHRTAELLNVPLSSLTVYASMHGIRFPHAGDRVSTAISLLEARLALAREIAAAGRERPAAPGYKPPGPLVW